MPILVNLDVMLAKRKMTLSQLAEEFDPPITKSCLNHRLRKLTELSRS